jgi:hypothetical protein
MSQVENFEDKLKKLKIFIFNDFIAPMSGTLNIAKSVLKDELSEEEKKMYLEIIEKFQDRVANMRQNIDEFFEKIFEIK